jgi:hypothetical protein
MLSQISVALCYAGTELHDPDATPSGKYRSAPTRYALPLMFHQYCTWLTLHHLTGMDASL